VLFENDLEKEDNLENLINNQFSALQKALGIPDDSERRKVLGRYLTFIELSDFFITH
jgi:hypothetical protein